MNKTISVLYVLTIIIFMHCIAGCEKNNVPSKQAEKVFHTGFVYFQKGNYYKAIEIFDQAIALYPKYSEAYQFRGSSYAKIELYTNAIRDYDKAIEFGSKYLDEIYLTRGAAHFELKEYDKAISDINKAIEISPNYALAYFSRGMIYAVLNDYGTAIRDFAKADELEPSEDCKIAINKMQTMIEDKYDDPGLVASRSIMNFSDGNYDKARQYWTDECRSANNAINYYLDNLTEKQKLVKVEVINQKIDDKIAIINVRLHTKDVCGYDNSGEHKYTTEKTLVATKEGTKWKLSLTDPDYVPITITGISQKTLNNSSYFFNEERITLKDGEYSNIHDKSYAHVNNIVYGDMNRDNKKDAIILLSYSGGGSGIFYCVIPIISKNGKAYQLKPTVLGDRVDIKSIKIISNALIVNMITQGPDDPSCCPTQKVKNIYKICCNGIHQTD